MADSSLTPVALRHRREKAIETLCEHFAQDHLEAEELEQLIDRAHQAATLAELDALTAGLPALATPPATAAAPGAAARPPARGGHPSGPQMVVAIMGGAERKGSWIPARETHVVAVMGGVCLDFREAHLDPGVTEINVLALMGGVEIIVPPGIHVESSGIGIMGGFEHSGRGQFPVDSSVPVLRVTGMAFMGGVEIRSQPSGERSLRGPGRRGLRDEWRTAKQEMKSARRQLRDEIRRLGRGE